MKPAPPAMPAFIIDSREQKPYSLLPAVVSALPTGDYSLVGLESVAAVERKELSDFIGCVTQGRERFERELDRASTFRRFWVVIEGTIDLKSLAKMSKSIDVKGFDKLEKVDDKTK